MENKIFCWLRILAASALLGFVFAVHAAEGETPVVEQPAAMSETQLVAAQSTETTEVQPIAAQPSEMNEAPPAAAQPSEITEAAPSAPQQTESAEATPAATQPSPEEQARETLDARVQALKKEVKTLNRDLFILEEELLFPSSTQLAVFLSVDVGDYFRLDSVELKIDGKAVANHLYTQREQEALGKGGVQRLYMGNVKTGKHELVAVFNGPGPHDRDYRRATTITFEKGSAVKYLELKIMDVSKTLQPEFVVKEWE